MTDMFARDIADHVPDQPARPTLRELTAPWRQAALVAKVRLAILQQDRYWVPRAAWTPFAQASVKMVTYHDVGPGDVHSGRVLASHTVVQPDWTVPGVVEVARMNPAWKQNCAAMIARQSKGTCMGMSFEFMLSDYAPGAGLEPSDMAQDGIDAEQAEWERLAADEDDRAAWLSQMPLMKALMP